MAEPNAKPKTSKPKTPKAKPTPPGQGSIDFTTSRYGSPGPGKAYNPNLASTSIEFNAIGGRGFRNNPQTRAGMGGRPMVSSPVNNPGATLQSRTTNSSVGKPSTPPRTGGSFVSDGKQATGRFKEVIIPRKTSGKGNKSNANRRTIIEPPTPPKTSTPIGIPAPPSGVSSFGSGGAMGSGGVKRTGGFGNVVQGPSLNTSSRYSGPVPGDSTGRGNMGVGPNSPNARNYFGKGASASSKNNPIINPGAALERVTPSGALGPVRSVDKVDDAAKVIGGVVKGKPKSKWGLIAAGLGAAALGTGYLMSRRNENEDAAKPQQAGANISIPGRNSPPSSGNEADRALYPAPDGPTNTAGSKASEPGLSARVRNNQKANRSPQDYLGEAFDATIKRGRDVGRKHLQGMLVRDSIDESTARNLMSRYDKEIGSQRTLKDYKSEGVAEKFDRENPGKAGRILDEYRGMGRRDGAAPAGATYAQIKERALR